VWDFVERIAAGRDRADHFGAEVGKHPTGHRTRLTGQIDDHQAVEQR
jgi:hypothetical protein